jgi:hypothetical protein
MTKQKLNLVKFAAGVMTEPSASSPKIMGSEFFDAGLSRILSDDMPHDLLTEPISPESVAPPVRKTACPPDRSETAGKCKRSEPVTAPREVRHALPEGFRVVGSWSASRKMSANTD